MRLLLVDDNDSVRRSIRDLLEDAGLIVVGEARDGLEALDFVADDRVDAVVMDCQMPRMDGVAATKEIRNNHPDITVIGYSSDAWAGQAMLDSGAAGFVVKGSRSHELRDALLALSHVSRTEGEPV